MSLTVGVLIILALALVSVVLWMLWTTIRVSGSIRRSRSDADSSGTNGKTTRLDAELYVETYRKKRSERNRSMGGRGR